MKEIKCPYCGKEFNTYSELEQHLKNFHFMSVQDYVERDNSSFEGHSCWKCGKPLIPLTFLDNENYYLPCWDCIGNNKFERDNIIGSIQTAIKTFYSKILGDRYFQMFIIDDIYTKTTLTHEFGEFKKVLKLLLQKEAKDRNKLWLIDFIPGYPKTICEENINGLHLVSIDNQFKYTSRGKTLILKDYELVYPDIIPYDNRHHSRYNILNSSDVRKTKRLRLSPTGEGEKSNRCIKFFNTENDNIKALFRIRRFSTGDEISYRDLSYADFTILKLILLRNKNFVRLVMEMLEEFTRDVGIFRDGIFLKNTIIINPDNPLKVNITWTPEYREGYINISIL